MRLYLRGSRDALFFHPMTPQKGKPIHYLICVCDCISVVALKIAQTLINKQWIHCNGKIKGDLPWKGQKKGKKNSGKLQRWGPAWTTQKGHLSGSLPFSLILELSHEVLKSRKEKCTWTCPLKCIFPWRDLPGNDQKSILALYCGFCDIRVVKSTNKRSLKTSLLFKNNAFRASLTMNLSGWFSVILFTGCLAFSCQDELNNTKGNWKKTGSV